MPPSTSDQIMQRPDSKEIEAQASTLHFMHSNLNLFFFKEEKSYPAHLSPGCSECQRARPSQRSAPPAHGSISKSSGMCAPRRPPRQLPQTVGSRTRAKGPTPRSDGPGRPEFKPWFGAAAYAVPVRHRNKFPPTTPTRWLGDETRRRRHTRGEPVRGGYKRAGGGRGGGGGARGECGRS